MLRATLAALLLGRHPAPTALHSTALRQSNGQQQERGWKKPWSTGSQIPLTHALFFNVVTHIKSSYTPRAGIRNIQFCCWHVVVETNDPWTYAKPVVLQNKNLLIWEDVILKVLWTVCWDGSELTQLELGFSGVWHWHQNRDWKKYIYILLLLLDSGSCLQPTAPFCRLYKLAVGW